jgi:hypothetical protein
MKNEMFDYMNAKDRELWAFQWFLTCTPEQVRIFVDAMNDREMRAAVDPAFVWAADAIEAMATD